MRDGYFYVSVRRKGALFKEKAYIHLFINENGEEDFGVTKKKSEADQFFREEAYEIINELRDLGIFDTFLEKVDEDE